MPRIRTSPLFLVGSALLVGAPRAAAQEVADTFYLADLVATATRVPIPRAAVPAAVTVLSGAELRARGVRFVADALREVAGASLVRSGSLGGLTALFLRGGESDYVQVLIDGVVLNDPGGSLDLGQLTTDEIERIEVVRGPVSVLYGSDAVTGVVHIFTRSGPGDGVVGPRLDASVELGTSGRRSDDVALCPAATCPATVDLDAYGTRRVAVGLAGSLGRLSYALGASDIGSDGAYPFNNAYDNRTASVRARLGDEVGAAALTVRYTDALYRYPTDGAGRLVDANTYRSSESLALGLDAGRWWGGRVETRLALSVHDGDYATVDAADGAADTLGFFRSRSDDRVDRRKGDLHVNVRAPAATIVTVGVEAERQDGVSGFTSDSEFGPFEGATANDRSNRALYGQLTGSPLPWLSVTAGGRTESNDRFGSFVTWRAGANLRGAGAVLRASSGNAFKEPTFFENYAEGFTVGNPELEPEQSRSWEIGAERSFVRNRMTIGATWFDQRFENLIMYTATPAPGAPNYVNIGEAIARGLELEARVGSAAGASATASWVRLATEVTDEGEGGDRLFQRGAALIRRPKDRLNLTASSPLGGRVRVGGSVVHVGVRDDLDFTSDFSGARVTLRAYTVADAFVEARMWASGTRDLTLRVRVENALGEEYQEVANFPGPKRALFVGVAAATGF